MTPADVYDFTKIRPGNEIAGPAVIHTPITTIVVQDAQRARMDELRNVVIDSAEVRPWTRLPSRSSGTGCSASSMKR